MTKTNETIVDASSVSINVKINELILKREKWDKVYHTAQLGLYAILHGCFEAFKEYQTSSADNKTVIKEELNVRHLKTENPIKTDDVATVRHHSNWNTWRPDLREDLAHLVQDIKRRVCGIASAGLRLFSVLSFPVVLK